MEIVFTRHPGAGIRYAFVINCRLIDPTRVRAGWQAARLWSLRSREPYFALEVGDVSFGNTAGQYLRDDDMQFGTRSRERSRSQLLFSQISRRVHSYYAISIGMQLGKRPAEPFFDCTSVFTGV